MNLGSQKTSRIFYIILVPVILVVILLNSGVLQARLPAVTIAGNHYNVSQFNYYYFSCLNEFEAENFDENGLNGPFDQSVDLRDQTREDGTTWEDYFLQQAEERLIEVDHYSTAASAAGYEFSEEELAPIQEQLDANTADAADSKITLKNYYIAYYGTGMTEAVYTQELTRETQANAYRQYLYTVGDVSDEEIDRYIEENSPEQYPSANLQMITLYAASDRFTGEVGDQQRSDLQEKIDRLEARYQSAPETFSELCDAFCEDESLANKGGVLDNTIRENLPALAAAWVFDETHTDGETTTLMDEENNAAYLIVYNGEGEDAARLTAAYYLRQAREEETMAEVKDTAQVSYNSLGKHLIGR